jgi:hypothetical protein
METLNGFMIMPFLTREENEKIKDKGITSIQEDAIKAKHLCNEFYEKIVKQQCISLGISIERADKVFKKQEVVNKIITEIEKSDIVIVDLTLYKPSVMYELGIAHYIDPNRTLLITQENFDDIPFDIKGYEILQYNSTDAQFANELSEKLKGLKEYHYEDEISIGVSAFPELFLLQKEFIDKKIKIKFKEVHWDEIFDHFEQNLRVDFVIANSEFCYNRSKEIIPTPYIYAKDLIKYNSFYIITKNNSYKSFKEFNSEIENENNCLKKTLEQFNQKSRKIVVYACGKTDHAETFRRFNNACGNALKKLEIKEIGSSKDILSDFITKEDGDLFFGSIPERINLLKNPKYKLILEFNDFKHIKSNKLLMSELQQKNGIVYHRIKEREIENIGDKVEQIKKLWNEAYSHIVNRKKRDSGIVEEYLEYYNNSDYVKTFDLNGINLNIDSNDFVNNYIENNLISIV